MKTISKMLAVASFGALCAACSPSQPPATQPEASAPPPAPAASAIPLQPPAPAASTAEAVAPTRGPTLSAMLQRPAFAEAFHAMDGADALPAWARDGGVSSPSQRVEIDGTPMWLAESCESEGCQDGRLLLLFDGQRHLMQGLLIDVSGQPGARVQQLVWLGHPDAMTQAFLKAQSASD